MKKYFVFELFFLLTISQYLHTEAQMRTTEVVKNVLPSVVVVLSYNETGKEISRGTGFFVSPNEILTAYHIVENAESVKIKTSQKVFETTGVTGSDVENDLIKLSIEGMGAPLYFAPPDTANVGQPVIVIGNPFGLESSVSDGIISGIRKIEGLGNVIQITASVYEGSSGGPVLNLDGRVVGIVSALFKDTNGISFAVQKRDLLSQKKGTLKETIAKNNQKYLTSEKGKIETAVEKISSNQNDEALNILYSIVEKNPNSYDTWYYIGCVYKNIGEFDKAIDSLENAVKIKETIPRIEKISLLMNRTKPEIDDATIFYTLGVLYRQMGYNTEAVRLLNKALEKRNDYFEALYNLGVAQANLLCFYDAIDSFEKALQIKNDAEVFNLLGVALTGAERYNEAMDAFKEAIKLKSGYFEAHYNLSVVYSEMNRLEEAKKSYKKAIQLSSTTAKAYYGLATVYTKMKKYNKSLKILLKSSEIEPENPWLYYKIGINYMKLEEYKSAVKAYKRSIQLKPDFAEAHYNLGITYLKNGDKFSAIDEYKFLLEVSSDLASRILKQIYQ